MATFNTGIDTSGSNAPAVAAPDFSQSQSTVGDIAVLAKFGAGLLANQQKQAATEAKAKHSENIAATALKVNAKQLELQNQRASAFEISKQTGDMIKSLPAADQLAVRTAANKLNDVVDKQLNDEIARKKAQDAADQAESIKFLGVDFDKTNRHQKETIELMASKEAKRNEEIKQLDLEAKQATSITTKASLRSKAITGELFGRVSEVLTKDIYHLRQRLGNGEIDEKQFQSELTVKMDRGLIELNSGIQKLVESEDPLVASDVVNRTQTIIQNYQSLVKGYSDSAAGTPRAKAQQAVVEANEIAVKLKLSEHPDTNTLMVLAKAGVIDPNAFTKSIDFIGNGLFERATKHVVKLLGDSVSEAQAEDIAKKQTELSIPHKDSKHGYVSQVFALASTSKPGSKEDDAEVKALAETNAAVQNGITADLKSGAIKDPTGQVKEVNDSDALKSHAYMGDNPSKHQFGDEVFKGVINIGEGFDKLSSVNKVKAAQTTSKYLANFVGDNNNGKFIPSLNASYAKIAPKGVNLYTAGIDPHTGGIKIVLASDAEIDAAVNTKSLGQFDLNFNGESNRIKLKRDLAKWASAVENNKKLNSLINVTAKTTGVAKEVVVRQLLLQMGSSGIPIDESVTVAPAETPKPKDSKTQKPKSNNTITPAENASIDAQIQALSNAEFKAFIDVDPRTQEVLSKLPKSSQENFKSLPREKQQRIISMSPEAIQDLAATFAPVGG